MGLPVEGTIEVALFSHEEATPLVPFFVGVSRHTTVSTDSRQRIHHTQHAGDSADSASKSQTK
jgi:hypothetical protein